MKFADRFAVGVVAMVVLALGVTMCVTNARAQEESWWIVRAEYGTRSQHNDVTDILKDLIGRGGVNGRVAVNNQTMGGDPAIGADKTLRIFARNSRNEEREFDYREGGFVPAGMFSVRREHGDRDDRMPAYGGHEQRDPGDYRGLVILRAYYGVQGRTVDVTESLRRLMRDGAVSFMVTNRALGGDPAIGADKVLIVVYRYQGNETATAVREGNVLTLP